MGMFDGMMYGYRGYGYPMAGMFIWMFIAWLVQLVIGYLVYRDAKDRQMNAVLWLILVIIPGIGWLFLILYVIIRETSGHGHLPGSESALNILNERYARGEITAEQYRSMKDELKK